MTVKGFRNAGHTPSLIAALVHFDVSFMVWVLLGALGAFVASDLHLSSAQKGLMVAIPPLGGAIFRLILGSLADRVGVKATGLVALSFVFVPLGWASLAGGTYGQVLGIGLLLGVAGASFAVALPLASRWYPPEYQGLALGIAGAGNSGTVVAALVAPRLAAHVGWHAVFGLAAIPVAVAWIVFAVFAKEPPRTAGPTGLFSLLREGDARSLCAFYMVTFGGFVGLAGYLPIFFVDRFGLDKVTAATYAAMCTLSGSVLRPVGGALADRLGGTRVLKGVLAGVGVIAFGLSSLPGLAATAVGLGLTLGLLGMGNGAVFQLVPQRFPSRIGAMTGLVGAAGGVGGFLLPFGLASLKGTMGTFATGFVVFAVVAILAAVGVQLRQRSWSLSWAQPRQEAFT